MIEQVENRSAQQHADPIAVSKRERGNQRNGKSGLDSPAIEIHELGAGPLFQLSSVSRWMGVPLS